MRTVWLEGVDGGCTVGGGRVRGRPRLDRMDGVNTPILLVSPLCICVYDKYQFNYFFRISLSKPFL